jgi:clan AA aspartic protease (TIGR02281 family)
MQKNMWCTIPIYVENLCRYKAIGYLWTLRCVGMVLAAYLLASCGGGGRTDARPSQTVPMAVQAGHPSVQVQVNGKALRFLIDTGADVNLITPSAAAQLALKPTGPSVPAVGAGGTIMITPVLWDSLRVGDIELQQQAASVTEFPQEFAYDGVLGAPFLAQFVASFDYEQHRFTLAVHSSFAVPPDATMLPMRIQGTKSFVWANAAGVEGWYVIDTGSSKAMLFYTPTVEQYNLRTQLSPTINAVTGVGVGGRTRGEIARARTLQLGPHRFAQVLVELSTQTSGSLADPSTAGHIGGEIWRRFTLTMDYVNNRLYLQPNKAYSETFVGPRSGLVLGYDQGAVVAVTVMPFSPAAQAGVVVGDELVLLNYMLAKDTSIYVLNDALKTAQGTTVSMRLRKTDGTEYDISLVLRDLL